MHYEPIPDNARWLRDWQSVSDHHAYRGAWWLNDPYTDDGVGADLVRRKPNRRNTHRQRSPTLTRRRKRVSHVDKPDPTAPSALAR